MTFHSPSSWKSIITCRPKRQALLRYLSTNAKNVVDNKAFTDTLLLPKTPFPLRADLKENEARYGDLTRENLYRWQSENVKGPVFVFHDGPPYANGDLHMGHALNKVVKDIINRFHLLQGRRIHYVPGWDCHGLPIENKAMKDMGRNPLDTPASVIRKGAEATALREVDSQREQFRPLGIMADWYSKDGTYRTLDRHYEIRQLRIFQKMVEKGQIYRQHRPVHYSPSSHSALAEAELEYKDDHVSHSVYVKFDLESASVSSNLALGQLVEREPVQLLVWTTTPWTLTANMGIAVHEELVYEVVRHAGGMLIVARDRLEHLAKFLGATESIGSITGTDLVDLSYKPLFTASTQLLKIIHAPHVTALSGTGLVHCAPAHGAEDYDAFRELGLLSPANTSNGLLCHVNSKGQFTHDVADVVGTEYAERLAGKEVLGNGNKEMVMLLKDAGKIVKIERIKHRYPYDWKTNEPIIVTATSQWFANLDFIKEDALNALKDVSFFPEGSRNRLESFVRSRSEWCISRQRAWGVPIPALHHIESGRVVLDSPTLDYIINALEQKNLDWWGSPVEEFVPPELLESGKSAAEKWEKGRDTMDVWFDSGTSWSMLVEMGVGRDCSASGGSGGRKFHADLCLEGSDQHRGWFQSQLLTAIGSRAPGEEAVSPYASLITHGMVLDEKGKKISKSLGNIISPTTLLYGSPDKKQPAYGPDLLRLWAASVDFWKDMSIGPTVIAQANESLRKLRNTARFCLGNMGDRERMATMERVPRAEMGLLEKYVMHELYTLEQTALEGYKSYNFPKVIHALNNFVNITLSSFYFDITKDCLYANRVESHERRVVVAVLEQILGTLSKVVAPVLPYLAEEIHATWKGDGKSIFMTPWTPLSDEWKDQQAFDEMTTLLALRTNVLSLLENARREQRIRSSLEAGINLTLPNLEQAPPFVQLLRREETFLKTLCIVSDTQLHEGETSQENAALWSYTSSFSMPGSEIPLLVHVQPARQSKCPRCWTYTRPSDDIMCGRCAGVVDDLHHVHS
ncbi:hypothetical protein M413DRAFT_444780 [Hebeloma cylindrosporum]|uniref:isoleucine--tRNA ligase n=1 Tax=Hebeloma cylindrosporum TaxID=76867 RepID=A0A0C3C0E8_HEBCY|nr:hypothetical protein M413DRAFT_444780 [Hebeloma cylindrosporum h7]